MSESKYEVALAARKAQEKASDTMGRVLSQTRYRHTAEAIEADHVTLALKIALFHGNGFTAGFDERMASFIAKAVEEELPSILQRARLLMRDDFKAAAAEAAVEAWHVLDWAGEEATL